MASKVKKTIAEINERIKSGRAVVVTAEEMTEIVRTMGKEKAARPCGWRLQLNGGN